ncbi:MAG: hypothetical protein AB1696_19670 [Planctomycetota bacterium]
MAYVPGEAPLSTAEGSRTGDIVKINVSEVQFDVGNTSDEGDDIIAVGGAIPVRVRVFPWWPSDKAVRIDTEGEGDLQYSRTQENFTDTLDLTLDRAGLWTQIYATGKEGPEDDPTLYTSVNPDDTYIVAYGGDEKAGKEDVTGFIIIVDPKKNDDGESKICAETGFQMNSASLDLMQKAHIYVRAKGEQATQYLQNVKLEIDKITPNDGYIPIGQGELKEPEAGKEFWVYTSFVEPTFDKWPEPKTVWIKATINDRTIHALVPIHVYPVLKFLTTPHQSKPGSAEIEPTAADFKLAMDYVGWKYELDRILPRYTTYQYTNRISPLLGYDDIARTYGYSTGIAFTLVSPKAFQTENICASLMLHENYHAYQGSSAFWSGKVSFEIDALLWELKHSVQTGIRGGRAPLTKILNEGYYEGTLELLDELSRVPER